VSFDTDVLIAGAGPVGATLALDLARRGVHVTVLEQSASPRRLPKMERCNARTMEIFRRLGLAETIRNASKFTPMPMDVFVLADFKYPPLLHLRYPSVPQEQARIAAQREAGLPLEPQQLVSQYTLEPILRAAASRAGASVHYGIALKSFEQDGTGVTALATFGDGNTRRIRTRWLVGCDGGTSTVRKQLGIALEGRGRLRRVHQVFFRSEQLFERIPVGRGRQYYFAEGAIVVQDDLQHFMVNFQDWEDGQDAEARLRRMIGLEMDIEVLHEGDWQHHLLVAERYRGGRAFIAGDAAHLVIPQGGLGMNTGIGDAVDLGWKLAAAVQGWAGAALLDTYEAERRETGLRNRDASGAAAEGVRSWRSAVGPEIRAETPAGAAMRARVAALAAAGQPLGHEMVGSELGYRYTASPIVVTEPAAPHSAVRDYLPTATPGVRLPHMWTAAGRAIHDLLGSGYTLLDTGSDATDASELAAAMRELNVPFEVLHLPEPALMQAYGRRLLLLRPDLHVAWRGDSLPADPAALAALVTGHVSTPLATH
jgi:2-polyprenyl-6-methoxyphenol hydroxylase-like FAD-dependent oxidoreductase